MPCSFHVTLDPFLNSGDVFFRVLQFLTDIVGLAASDKTVLGRLAGLGVDRPASMLDAGGDVVGATVGFGVLKVEIFRSSW